MVVNQGLGEEEVWELVFNGEDEKLLEMGGGDTCTTM